jgi:glutathione S-transferase
MDVRLYVVPASHPSSSASLMLEYKGIPYKRIDLMPVISRGILKLMRFPGVTVPSLKIDGRRITGSREIAQELERIQPEPPLFPSDPGLRTAVEEAERFGDEDLQHAIRQPIWWLLRRNRKPVRSYLEGAKLGIPLGLAARTAMPIIVADARINQATDENVRRDLAALPGMLQRIDDWIADGVIGGEQPNAADFQLAPTLRLAMTMEDLRPAIEPRPAGALAMRFVPSFAGQTPPGLPPEWLAPLRQQPAAA